MLPGSIANLLRLAGIVISAVLAGLPWLITTGSEDPFLFQGWALLASGSIAVCIVSAIFIFFRPRQGQIPFVSSFFLLFAGIALATVHSNFLVSLKSSMILLSLLLLAGFLRLCRQSRDNLAMAGMVVLSGFLMSVYGLAQHLGYDILSWNSQYLMVGTFSNPNFFGTFIAITALFTLGLALDPNLRRTNTRLIFLAMFAVQFVVILLSQRSGVTLTFCFGLILLFTRSWEVRPGRILRVSPLISGFLLAAVLIFFHGLVYYSTSNYPWGTLQSPPSHHFPLVTRLILWQMGFSVFLAHPVTGLGPGSLPYLMPLQRPPFGSAIGIKIFNDDPHSSAITLLAETGLIGLIAACSIFAVIYGCFVWFRFKNSRDPEQPNEHNDNNETTVVEGENAIIVQPAWSLTLGTIAGTLVTFSSGLLPVAYLLYAIPLSIAAFGIQNSFIAANTTHKEPMLPNLPKATMVALLSLAFNSLFNTSFSVLPLMGFAVLIFGLHFSACQRDIVWKRKFSFVSLLFICFPAMYVFAAYNFQIAYHREQLGLFNGQKFLNLQNYAESQKAFESAIQINSQSLKAHYGLAICLEKLNKLDESQEILKRLDSMVPNAFNSNFELARILLDRKQILEAHRYALKSLQWDQAPRTYELLGKILVSEGKFLEAEKIFTEGLLLVPLNTYDMEAADRIRISLAAIMANRGDLPQCEKYLDAIRTSVREQVDVLYLRGMMLSRQKKPDEALDLFEQALKLSPENPRFINAVGYILTEQGQDLTRAQSLLESAYAIVKRSNPPNLSDLLMIAHSLGKLYWKSGRHNEARQLLEIAYEQCPTEWVSLKAERLEDLQQFLKQNGTGSAAENAEQKSVFSAPETVIPDQKSSNDASATTPISTPQENQP